MNQVNIWDIMNSAQVSTALVLIAIVLVYFAFQFHQKRSSR